MDVGPVVSYRFDIPGGMLERDFYVADLEAMSREAFDALAEMPDFIEGGTREWLHPQDLITYRGRVKAGREDEARAWLKGRDE